MTKKNVFITTAIDYTNDVIHIGQAYEKILADCVARYYRFKLGDTGNGEKVYFLTGTDEHGTTNEKAARARNLEPLAHVNEISTKDKEQIDSLNISYNRFIRTTDEDHKKVVTEFLKKALETGDVYKSKYVGYYCEGCESHKTLSELNENKQCPLHLTRQIQELEEDNYFFKLSKYMDFLKDLIKNSPKFILPAGKQNEMLAFLERGLNDIPISRPFTKVPWGIPVPGDEEQVVYVWYDALVNYYTAGIQNGFWNEETKIIHFVGKDIVRFHTLLWPAMLKNVNYHLPDTVYVHGFINLNGEKISKSRGNVIRPLELVEQFGADAVRYYFLKHGPITEDVSVSLEHLKEVYNSDLANGLGNTVARIAKLAEISEFEFPPHTTNQEEELGETFEVFSRFNDFRVDLVLQKIWEKLAELDKHINENEPWKISDKQKLHEVLDYEINQIRNAAKWVEPFIPGTALKIQKQFAESNIKTSEVLFPRL